MRINKTKLHIANNLLLSIGGEVKTEADFIKAIKLCIEKIKKGHATRKENTLNETWGIDDIERLINCIDYKEPDK